MIKNTYKIEAFLKVQKEEPRNEEVGKGVQKPGQKLATVVNTQPGLELPSSQGKEEPG